MTLKKSFKAGYAKRKLEENIEKLFVLQNKFFVNSLNFTHDQVGASLTQALRYRAKKIQKDDEDMNSETLEEMEENLTDINSDLIDYALVFSQLMYDDYVKKK